MARYLILNLVFMAAVLLLFKAKPRKPSQTWWLTLAVLLALTAVFDSLIIAAGIVGYQTENILGIYIFRAPIEDFAYTLLAVITVPLLWNREGRSK